RVVGAGVGDGFGHAHLARIRHPIASRANRLADLLERVSLAFSQIHVAELIARSWVTVVQLRAVAATPRRPEATAAHSLERATPSGIQAYSSRPWTANCSSPTV